MKSKALWIGIGIALVAIVGIYFLMAERKNVDVGGYLIASSTFAYRYSDIIGTHVGTTTVGVAFTGAAATSTYISKIGSANMATYFINATAVADADNALSFTVQGSVDPYCDTATSTATGEVWTQHINWFPTTDHLRGNVHSTSFGSASSTAIAWEDMIAGASNEIVLTDLNYECLKLGVQGASSTIYVGLKIK